MKSGHWLYAGEVAMPVDVIGLPYDFWYEIARADDRLKPGETAAPLGEDGLLYYTRFHHAGQSTERTWPDSPGFGTVDAAMRHAESHAPVPIHWADEPADPRA